MATYTVDTDGGGDYSSWDSFLSDVGTGVESDLTTAGGHIINLQGATNDTSSPSWTGSTFTNSTASNNLVFQGDCSGTWDDGNYILDPASYVGHIIAWSGDLYVEIKNIQVLRDSNDNSNKAAIRSSYCGASSATEISGCYLRQTTATSSQNGIELNVSRNSGQTSPALVYNNVIEDFTGRGIYTNSIGAQRVLNNTVIDCGTGIDKNSNAVSGSDIINNACFGNTTDIAGLGSYTGTNSTNATSDTTGTSGLTSLTATDEFTDYSGGDYSLKAASNLVDAGTDLSSDFTIDIVGATRSATFDVSAYEYIAAGGGVSIPVIMNQLRNQGIN